MDPSVESIYNYFKNQFPDKNWGTVEDFDKFVRQPGGDVAVHDFLKNNVPDKNWGTIDDFRSFIGAGEEEVPVTEEAEAMESGFAHPLTVRSESRGDSGARSQYKDPNTGFLGFGRKKEESFGLYQFNLPNGELGKFLNWAKKKGIDTPDMNANDVEAWFRQNADRDNFGFGKLQEEYVEENIMPTVLDKFNGNFDIDNDPLLKDLLLSTRIQFGPGGYNSILKSIGPTNSREEFINKITQEKKDRFPRTAERYDVERDTVLQNAPIQVAGVATRGGQDSGQDGGQVDEQAEEKVEQRSPEENEILDLVFANNPAARNLIKYLPFGLSDWVEDVVIRGGVRGLMMGQTVDDIWKLYSEDSQNISDEDIQKLIQASKQSELVGQSDEMMEFAEKGMFTTWEGIKTFAKNGLTILPEVAAQSITQMLNAPVIQSAAEGSVAGGLAGAAAGAVAGGVGAVPGAMAGAMQGALFGGIKTLDTTFRYLELLQEEVEKSGGNFENKDDVRKILENEELNSKLKWRAHKAGMTMAAIGTATSIVAGGIGARVAGTGRRVGAVGAAEAIGESGGEAGARLAAGQKLDINDIILEGLSSGPGAATALAQAKILGRGQEYTVNGERVSQNEMEDFLKNSSDEDFINSQWQLKEDSQLETRFNDRKESIEINRSIDETSSVTGEQRQRLFDLEKKHRQLLKQKEKSPNDELIPIAISNVQKEKRQIIDENPAIQPTEAVTTETTEPGTERVGREAVGKDQKTIQEEAERPAAGTTIPRQRGKKVKTDFDDTLYDNKTGELTDLGQDLARRIREGEDVTVLTAREDTQENRNFIAEKLGIDPTKIVLGLDPQGKAANLQEGDIFVDNNADNLAAAMEVSGVNVFTTDATAGIVPLFPAEVLDANELLATEPAPQAVEVGGRKLTKVGDKWFRVTKDGVPYKRPVGNQKIIDEAESKLGEITTLPTDQQKVLKEDINPKVKVDVEPGELQVFRGVREGATENPGFLWVTSDENVANEYTSSEFQGEGEGRVESFNIQEPKSSFEFPYRSSNTDVKGSNIAGVLEQEVSIQVDNGKITPEKGTELLNKVDEFSKKAGEKLEKWHTKLNKPGAAEVASEILSDLGYDSVKIYEGPNKSRPTIGLLKRPKPKAKPRRKKPAPKKPTPKKPTPKKPAPKKPTPAQRIRALKDQVAQLVKSATLTNSTTISEENKAAAKDFESLMVKTQKKKKPVITVGNKNIGMTKVNDKYYRTKSDGTPSKVEIKNQEYITEYESKVSEGKKSNLSSVDENNEVKQVCVK